MEALILVTIIVGLGLYALVRASRIESRRFSGRGMAVIEELLHAPHAAEHLHLEEHTAFLADDDDDPAGPDTPRRNPSGPDGGFSPQRVPPAPPATSHP